MELIDEKENRRLRISSKRLKSGKVQVSFKYFSNENREHSGYLLAEPKTSLKEVVNKIMSDLSESSSHRFHKHLFSLGKIRQNRDLVILN